MYALTGFVKSVPFAAFSRASSWALTNAARHGKVNKKEAARMGKKTYHIVDPETGEVVGEKRMGRIRQAYYKTPPNGRALFVLSLIPAFLMAASAVIGFILFFCRDHIPNRLSSVIFYVLVINAAISLLLIFLWSVLNELHLKKGSEAEEAESDQ